MNQPTAAPTASVLRFPDIPGKAKADAAPSRDCADLVKKLEVLERLRPGAVAVVELLVDDFLADAIEKGGA